MITNLPVYCTLHRYSRKEAQFFSGRGETNTAVLSRQSWYEKGGGTGCTCTVWIGIPALYRQIQRRALCSRYRYKYCLPYLCRVGEEFLFVNYRYYYCTCTGSNTGTCTTLSRAIVLYFVYRTWVFICVLVGSLLARCWTAEHMFSQYDRYMYCTVTYRYAWSIACGGQCRSFCLCTYRQWCFAKVRGLEMHSPNLLLFLIIVLQYLYSTGIVSYSCRTAYCTLPVQALSPN